MITLRRMDKWHTGYYGVWMTTIEDIIGCVLAYAKNDIMDCIIFSDSCLWLVPTQGIMMCAWLPRRPLWCVYASTAHTGHYDVCIVYLMKSLMDCIIFSAASSWLLQDIIYMYTTYLTNSLMDCIIFSAPSFWLLPIQAIIMCASLKAIRWSSAWGWHVSYKSIHLSPTFTSKTHVHQYFKLKVV